MAQFSQPDPLLARASELLAKQPPSETATLWLKPPSNFARPGDDESRFWHPWYPEHRALLDQGWKALESSRKWQEIVLFGGKHKEENLELLDYAAAHLGPEGRVRYLVPNDYGSKSYQKPLAAKFAKLDYQSGRKSRLYELAEPLQTDPQQLWSLRQVKGEFWTCPGLFSWQKPDRGSVVLARTLQERNLSGPVADLGAGWGYLVSQLPSDLRAELFEADSRGVEACRKNLEGRSIEAHWSNVTALAQDRRFQTVITNPPFHAGKKSEPVLGATFVASAHRLLKPRGELYLVGNSHLPYPRIVGSFFEEVEVLRREDGFAVTLGRNPV